MERDLNTHATVNIGKRALVTGAFSGIGAAIARELAALGVDLVLTGRRRVALDAAAATCKGVKVEIVTADLGKPDTARELWDAATASGPVDILINNAGFGYFRRLDEIDWARDAELIQLNMASLVHSLGASWMRARQAPNPRTGEHRVDRRVPVGAEHGVVRRVEGVRAQLQRRSPGRAPRPPSFGDLHLPWRHRPLSTPRSAGGTTRGSRTRPRKARSS